MNETIQRGTKPSAKCKQGSHKECKGIVNTKHGRGYCTCRCHGPRGFIPQTEADREVVAQKPLSPVKRALSYG